MIDKTAQYLAASFVLVVLSLVISYLFLLESAAERLMIGFSVTSGIGIIKGQNLRVRDLDADDHFNIDAKTDFPN